MSVRWLRSETVRRYWPALRGEYSRDFVRFCESELRMSRSEVLLVPVNSLDGGFATATKTLEGEFAAEWPTQTMLLASNFGLVDSISKLDTVNDAAMHLIALSSDNSTERTEPLPCGLLLISVGAHHQLNMHIWISGAYRSLGIGTEAMKLLRDPLSEVSNRFESIRVRYPASKRSTNYGDVQRRAWRRFFHNVDFKIEQAAVNPDDDLVLVRPLNA